MSTPFASTTRSLARDSAGPALVVWAVAFAALAAWLAWFTLGRVTVHEISRKARLEVRQAPHAVTTTLAGRVASSALAIGRVVRTGDVLAELDSGSEQLRLQEEEVHLRSIPARVASLWQEIASRTAGASIDRRSGLAAAQASQARVREVAASVEFAVDNERRLLAESGNGSIAEIDALRARAEARKQGSLRDALAAEAQRLELDVETRAHQNEAELESLRRTLVTLEADLASAHATVARLALDIDKRRIRAPIDGVIAESMSLASGTFVSEGQRLATIVPGGDLVVIADFSPQSALGHVHAGQAARMRLDGFPWAQYGAVEAKVVRVSSEVRDNALRVELLPLRVAGDGPMMQHGLSGTVEIDIEEASPAVLLLRASGQRFAHPAGSLTAASAADR